jgi:hypothetical protein
VAEQSISENLVVALGVALMRKGVLDHMDLHDAAADADRAGEKDVAHALRCIVIEAEVGEPTP